MGTWTPALPLQTFKPPSKAFGSHPKFLVPKPRAPGIPTPTRKSTRFKRPTPKIRDSADVEDPDAGNPAPSPPTPTHQAPAKGCHPPIQPPQLQQAAHIGFCNSYPKSPPDRPNGTISYTPLHLQPPPHLHHAPPVLVNPCSRQTHCPHTSIPPGAWSSPHLVELEPEVQAGLQSHGGSPLQFPSSGLQSAVPPQTAWALGTEGPTAENSQFAWSWHAMHWQGAPLAQPHLTPPTPPTHTPQAAVDLQQVGQHPHPTPSYSASHVSQIDDASQQVGMDPHLTPSYPASYVSQAGGALQQVGMDPHLTPLTPATRFVPDAAGLQQVGVGAHINPFITPTHVPHEGAGVQHVGPKPTSKRSRECAFQHESWDCNGGTHVPIRDAGIQLPGSATCFTGPPTVHGMGVGLDSACWSNKRTCWDCLRHDFQQECGRDLDALPGTPQATEMITSQTHPQDTGSRSASPRYISPGQLLAAAYASRKRPLVSAAPIQPFPSQPEILRISLSAPLVQDQSPGPVIIHIKQEPDPATAAAALRPRISECNLPEAQMIDHISVAQVEVACRSPVPQAALDRDPDLMRPSPASADQHILHSRCLDAAVIEGSQEVPTPTVWDPNNDGALPALPEPMNAAVDNHEMAFQLAMGASGLQKKRCSILSRLAETQPAGCLADQQAAADMGMMGPGIHAAGAHPHIRLASSEVNIQVHHDLPQGWMSNVAGGTPADVQLLPDSDARHGTSAPAAGLMDVQPPSKAMGSSDDLHRGSETTAAAWQPAQTYS
ncbi:hypothetical protein WJX74_006200 [Apatococcus lobatus]|uniref:Uncharacterized protein n=1 Tax=Apatococcus lobatus TaxID=904363 RepID=A0AAW1QHS5_9CHLO